jgi:hypothetical protein
MRTENTSMRYLLSGRLQVLPLPSDASLPIAGQRDLRWGIEGEGREWSLRHGV